MIILTRLFDIGVVPTSIAEFIVHEDQMLHLARLCSLEPALRASAKLVTEFKDLVQWSCKKYAIRTGAIKLSASGDWKWVAKVASRDPIIFQENLDAQRESSDLNLLVSGMGGMSLTTKPEPK